MCNITLILFASDLQDSEVIHFAKSQQCWFSVTSKGFCMNSSQISQYLFGHSNYRFRKTPQGGQMLASGWADTGHMPTDCCLSDEQLESLSLTELGPAISEV